MCGGIFFLVFTIISLVGCKELPKYLHDLRCPHTDFEACFIKSANLGIPRIVKGDPEYHIPKMNPMEVPFVPLVSTPMLKLNLTNFRVHGLENMKMMSVKIRASDGLYTMMLKNPNITLEGQYSVDGQVMIMPIKGSGHFEIFLKNGVYKTTFFGKIIKKDDGDHYFATESPIDFNFDKIEFKFENLFEGNKQLGDQVNKFLNQNWDLLVTDFGRGVANTLSSIVCDIFNGLNSEIPLENYYLN